MCCQNLPTNLNNISTFIKLMLDYEYHGIPLSLYNISKYMLGYDRMVPEVHGVWADTLEKNREKYNRFVELRPRGTFKTTLFTVSQTIELLMEDWLNNNGQFDKRILIASATETLATQILGEISSHFISNPNIQEFFGYNPIRNAKYGELWLEPRSIHKEPTVKSIGSGTAIVSEHYNVIICDDICFDGETEVLTDKGWLFFKNLDGTELVASINPDTHFLEYQKPLRYIQHNYNGTMYGIKGRDSVDILVTEGHNIYWGTQKRHGNKTFSLQKVEDIYGKYGYVKKSCNWNGVYVDSITIPAAQYNNNYSSDKKVIPIDAFCEFLGLFLAEGNINSRHGKNYNSIIITQNCVADKCNEIRRILNLLPFEYKEYKGTGLKDGTITFYIGSSQLANYLHSLGGCTEVAKNKYIPSIIKTLPKEQIQKFIDGYFLGDGSTNNNGSKIIYTASSKMADDLQELIIKCGYTSTKQTHVMNTTNPSGTKYNTTQYRISIITGKCTPFIRPHHWYKQEYDGMVYCVEVPHHLIYIRRNGKVAIVGQCNSEDRESQAKRDKNWRWYIDMISILEPNGYLFVCGTRWHYDDIYAHLIKQNEKLPEHRKYLIEIESVLDEKTGLTNFPTILSDDDIVALKIEKGVVEFAAQYMNRCIPTETQLFPPDRMHVYPEYGKNADNFFTGRYRDYIYIDPALGQSTDGDYVVVIVGREWDRKLYIRDAFMSNTTTPKRVVKVTEQLMDTYDIPRVHIETNGFQSLYGKYFTDEGISIVEHKNTKRKEIRIEGLEPYYSSGKVMFREDWETAYPLFVEQLHLYPATDHDDAPDALESLTRIALKKKVDINNAENLVSGMSRVTMDKNLRFPYLGRG